MQKLSVCYIIVIIVICVYIYIMYQPNQNQPEIWFFKKNLAFRGLD